jgi:hypothetical protein
VLFECVCVCVCVYNLMPSLGVTGRDVEQVLAARNAALTAGLSAATTASEKRLWAHVMPAVSDTVFVLFDAVGIKGGIVCECAPRVRVCVCSDCVGTCVQITRRLVTQLVVLTAAR